MSSRVEGQNDLSGHHMGVKSLKWSLSNVQYHAGMMWAWDLTVTLGTTANQGSWMSRALAKNLHWVSHHWSVTHALHQFFVLDCNSSAPLHSVTCEVSIAYEVHRMSGYAA